MDFNYFLHLKSKNLTQEAIKLIIEGKLQYQELDRIQSRGDKFGYAIYVYGNEHLIEGKKHFHLIHKAENIDCRFDFDGNILDEKEGEKINKKIKKLIKEYCSLDKEKLENIWNKKNP
jgi:hypothetical protein